MNSSVLSLGPGDRVPNFTLPNPDGNLIMFYNKTKGGPVLLFFYDTNDETVAMRELAAFRQHREELAGFDAELFLINRDSPENNAALVTAHDLDCPVMADIMGQITAAMVAAVSAAAGEASVGRDRPVMVLALDRNQRLIECLWSGGDSLAAQSVALLQRHQPAVEAQSLSMTAPVLLLPNMLETDLCGQFMDDWETQGHKEGGVSAMKAGKAVKTVDFGKKKRLDHLVRDDQITAMLNRKVGSRIAEEVFKAFMFQEFYLERWVIGAYEASRQDRFRPHRDNLGVDTASRRFAVSINLNDGYEGGGIVFPEYGPHVYNAPAGGAMIFSCSLIHEALPVSRGRRFVLLSFLRDAKNRPHPWSVKAET